MPPCLITVGGGMENRTRRSHGTTNGSRTPNQLGCRFWGRQGKIINPQQGYEPTERRRRDKRRANKYGCDLMPQQRGLIDAKIYTNQAKTQCHNGNLKQKREDARRVDPFLRASLSYWQTVIKCHSVSDIAALQQHDKVERR